MSGSSSEEHGADHEDLVDEGVVSADPDAYIDGKAGLGSRGY